MAYKIISFCLALIVGISCEIEARAAAQAGMATTNTAIENAKSAIGASVASQQPPLQSGVSVESPNQLPNQSKTTTPNQVVKVGELKRRDSTDSGTSQDAVVVSDVPTVFTYFLTGVSCLLAIMTLFTAAAAYFGMRNAQATRVELEEAKTLRDGLAKALDGIDSKLKERERIILDGIGAKTKEIDEHVDSVMRDIESRALEAVAIRAVRKQLRSLLTEQLPDVTICFKLLSQLVGSRNVAENLELYGVALAKFSGNTDITSVVSRGLKSARYGA